MVGDVQFEPCPTDLLQAELAKGDGDDNKALGRVQDLIARYPGDARLHFLRGSLLASLQRYEEARPAMARAIEIAPEYHIARFQLGFLELSSGKPADAAVTWGPLYSLPENEYLRHFAQGLVHLIRDEFEPCVASLNRGMALNTEVPPLNGDMKLIIDRALEAAKGEPPPAQPEDPAQAVSATHLLLQQYQNRTRH